MAISKTNKPKESRKNSIIISALKVFCEKGYSSTTIDDITKKAKVSHGLFYHYFKSKKEIFNAVLELHENNSSEKLEEELQKEPSCREKLRIFLKRLYENIKNNEIYSYYFYFVITQCFSHKDKCKPKKCEGEHKPHVHPIVRLEKLFSEGQKQGEFIDKYSARECAEMLFSLTQGATLGYAIAPKEIQKNIKLPNIEFILDIFSKGDLNEKEQRKDK